MRCFFRVLGPPQPKERARWCPKQKRHVTPPKTRAYEELVGRIAMHARPREWEFRGAYHVEIHAYLHDRRARDLDNISKSVLDGLNRVLWLDDRQVVRLLVDKAIDPDHPRIEVVVDVVMGHACSATATATARRAAIHVVKGNGAANGRL